MTVWLEIAAQVKNATGEEIKFGETQWAWAVLRALEELSQRVVNLESQKPMDIER